MSYSPETAWATVTGGPGTRTSVVVTTGTLADGASENGTVTLAKSGRLLTFTVDRASRVQLYATTTTRTNDSARAFGVEVPATRQGVLLDYQSDGAETFVAHGSPAYHSGLDTPTVVGYYRITNLSGASSTVTVTIVHVPLEI